jgi:hypothetical protein
VTRASALPLALAILTGASPVASQAPDTAERSVLGAGAAYVAEYQRQLTSILADEIYTQEIVAQRPHDTKMPRKRRLRSEVFFMFAPATREWMAIRDVLEADGRPLESRPDLREALQTLSARDAASAFKDYNSRFNIGQTFRNFNEPTLALLVLDEQHRRRFSFDRRHVERAGGTVLVTIAFTEKDSPTLIRHVDRGRVFSKGELVVEAATGAIRRTALRGTIEKLRFELTTVYSPDARLGLWVPSVFTEGYEYGTRPGTDYNSGGFRPDRGSRTSARRSDYEKIVCEARYTNFRRFETSVRIK